MKANQKGGLSMGKFRRYTFTLALTIALLLTIAFSQWSPVLLSSFAEKNTSQEILPKEEPVVVATATRQLGDEYADTEKFVQAFSQLPIEPLTSFSMKKFIEEKKLTELSSEQISIVSSVLFEALLATNFIISERNIGSELPKNIQLGLEAKVDFSKNMDFSFYNPNKHPYDMKLSMNKRELEISIIGIPFSHKYEANLTEKQEFKPRTIKRYTPLLQPGQKYVETEGKPGFLIKVYRESISATGEWMESEWIAEDFYQPSYRVELIGIVPSSSPLPPQQGTLGTESMANPDTNGSSVSETPTASTENLAPAPNEQNPQQDPGQGTDGSVDDRLWGKPNEAPK